MTEEGKGEECMKILVVSDTHGHHENLKKILERVKPIDMLIHLGDVEGGENEIRTMAGCPCEIVAGNNDYFSRLPREKVIYIGRHRVLLTHGHMYRVSMGHEFLMEDARALGMNIVMFGHTHRPCIEQGYGIVAINPGSVSYPRQANHKPSYIVMELDHSGEAHFTIEYLEESLPKEWF